MKPPLPPKLLAVAAAIGRGLGNKEIAHELSISESTTKIYCHEIKTRLGISHQNRVGIALWVWQHPEFFQSLEPPPPAV